MIDILLLNPPLVNYDEKNKPKYLVNTSFFPPIGLAYLSSFLKKHNFSVKIIDMDAEKYGISKITDLIKIFKPLMIGISITSDLIFPISYKVIKKIKKETNVPIVVGGVFPTNNPDFLIKKPEIDFLVRGEGEHTLLELINFYKNKIGELKKINGLSYKINGVVYHNPPRELLKNLDDLPFPDWGEFDFKKYFISIAFKNPSFAITASRGCPYRCIFCSTSVFQYYRIRSPKNVVDEIEFLHKKYNVKDITFHDPTFNISPKWVINFCKELMKRKLKIKWRCLCRVDKIEDKMVHYMKSAGCYNIAFGIESSKDKFLNFLKKDFTIEQVKKAFKIVKKYKIEILAYFMYGIPGQTISDLRHNCRFIKEISPDYINILILNPVVGTELWNLAQKKGWLKDFNLEMFESPERLGVEKQWWKIPNLDEKILNHYIKMSYINYFFRFNTIRNYIVRYLRNPSRILFAIKNIIQRFTY
ncbi:MAG: B12-binding domain-containing radical SAM protein [Candidatus Helarchaeota archaeon]